MCEVRSDTLRAEAEIDELMKALLVCEKTLFVWKEPYFSVKTSPIYTGTTQHALTLCGARQKLRS